MKTQPKVQTVATQWAPGILLLTGRDSQGSRLGRRYRETDPAAATVKGTEHDRRQKIPDAHHELIRKAFARGVKRSALAASYGVKHQTITRITHPGYAAKQKAGCAAWHAKNGMTPERRAQRKAASKKALARKTALLDSGVALKQSQTLRTMRIAGTSKDQRVKFDPTGPQITRLRQLVAAGKMSIAAAAKEVGMTRQQAYPIVNRAEHRETKRKYALRVGAETSSTPEYRRSLRDRKRILLQCATKIA